MGYISRFLHNLVIILQENLRLVPRPFATSRRAAV